MTKIKLCGLMRMEDIDWANQLCPDYIGFVFAPSSRRYVSPEQAAALKARLSSDISAVGVFVREDPAQIAGLLKDGIIDIAQLHGGESPDYLCQLRTKTDCPIWQAFQVRTADDLTAAQDSAADCILLDSGSGGTGTVFDWSLLSNVRRPYFLAGGLTPENAGPAIRRLRLYGVDVSSGIETNGAKDPAKMAAFVAAVRKENRL